jgi:hypothetical protein
VFDRARGFRTAVPGLPEAPEAIDVQPALRWSATIEEIFLADERGRCHVWRHEHVAARRTRELAVRGGTVLAFEVDAGTPCRHRHAGRLRRASPPRVHAHAAGAAPKRLERFNDRELQGVSLGRVEERTIEGALGDAVQMSRSSTRRVSTP